MKHLYRSTAALLLSLPLSMVSFAAEPQKTAEPMQGMSQHQGMDMSKHQGMDMTKNQGKDAGKHQGMGMMSGMNEEHLRSMQEHMLMMHDYSNKILAEKDPAKQAQLKNQQLELMKAHQAQMMQHRQQMTQEHQ
jgi:hypothetical protein